MEQPQNEHATRRTGSFSVATHLVQPDMRVEFVHVRTELFVSFVSTLIPRLIWVYVPHELGEVNDPTKQVTQPVQILDHGKESDFSLFQ